jgi:hypothetical protein
VLFHLLEEVFFGHRFIRKLLQECGFQSISSAYAVHRSPYLL